MEECHPATAGVFSNNCEMYCVSDYLHSLRKARSSNKSTSQEKSCLQECVYQLVFVNHCDDETLISTQPAPLGM